jgi:hypothetical protein
MSKPSELTRTSTVYKVECRSTGMARKFGDVIIDSTWRPMPVNQSESGVGIAKGPENTIAGVCDYYEAVALAAWFLHHARYGVEARLVPYKMILKYELHSDGEPKSLPDELTMMFATAERAREAHKSGSAL